MTLAFPRIVVCPLTALYRHTLPKDGQMCAKERNSNGKVRRIEVPKILERDKIASRADGKHDNIPLFQCNYPMHSLHGSGTGTTLLRYNLSTHLFIGLHYFYSTAMEIYRFSVRGV
ncbi:uncharacterized protein LOC129777981 [Toxorhynchites rutilus septentrionalis]|uniref:uncharacterized protein LOC129777981 n=1 Tax=Toxorhynchites rutilus septentrionalis TaxID=329112 RepID=UPI00247A3F79|nr:uncharacterized protein LOC129777981 [Toxorhynchites rutilus septentrionalis]